MLSTGHDSMQQNSARLAYYKACFGSISCTSHLNDSARDHQCTRPPVRETNVTPLHHPTLLFHDIVCLNEAWMIEHDAPCNTCLAIQEPVDLDALKGSQRLTAAQARSQSASTSASTAPDSTTSAAEETLWLQFLAKMAGHIVANLPKIWQMTQVDALHTLL